jgi:hypothetical protein
MDSSVGRRAGPQVDDDAGSERVAPVAQRPGHRGRIQVAALRHERDPAINVQAFAPEIIPASRVEVES